MLESRGPSSSGIGLPENPNGVAPSNNVLEFHGKSMADASLAPERAFPGTLLHLDRKRTFPVSGTVSEPTNISTPNNVFEFGRKPEVDMQTPHIKLHLKPGQKVVRAMQLHSDRKAKVLSARVLSEGNPEEELTLPAGAMVWLKTDDGHQYLIDDHTSQPESGGKGTRGGDYLTWWETGT